MRMTASTGFCNFRQSTPLTIRLDGGAKKLQMQNMIQSRYCAMYDTINSVKTCEASLDYLHKEMATESDRFAEQRKLQTLFVILLFART